MKKDQIRKKFYLIRKKKYSKINFSFFKPLIEIIKQYKNKKKNISIYHPISYELDIMQIMQIKFFKTFNFLLPIIKKDCSMDFYKWSKNDVLKVNHLGIPEPIKSRIRIPDIILVPILAFDNKKNRLGYGKGFYDRYLNKLKRINNKCLAIGIAFSFQKHHGLPANNKDYKLDFIITEKGLIK